MAYHPGGVGAEDLAVRPAPTLFLNGNPILDNYMVMLFANKSSIKERG